MSNNGRVEKAIAFLKQQLAEIREEETRVVAALEAYGVKSTPKTEMVYAGMKASQAILKYLDHAVGEPIKCSVIIEALLAGGFGVQTKNPAREIKKSLAIFENHYWTVKRIGPRRVESEVVEADTISLLPLADRKPLKRRKKRK